jgi:hypothetical protein
MLPPLAWETLDRSWRRESNPEDRCHSELENKGSPASEAGLAADWQRKNCQRGDDVDSDLQIMRELHFLHTVWPHLPPQARHQLMYAIDAVRNQDSDNHHLAKRP